MFKLIKRRYHLYQARRAALCELRYDKRADVIYEYLSRAIEDVTAKRPLSVGQLEIIIAMLLGNVVAKSVNRHNTSATFKRIEKLARLLVNQRNVEQQNPNS